jgi:serine/threonine protein kinase/predicted ATPase
MREIGKYSVVAPIGTGGMAEVFLAKSYGAEGLEKRLVIKRILPQFAKKAKFVDMFIDEAKIAVSLNHPNIVQVYEFGKAGQTYFLAMEWVDGTDLGRVLSSLKREGRGLSLGDTAFIGVEVAKALDYAHRKRDLFGRPLCIVHRDVSPQNILITWDGSVKLVDFGIAKARNTTGERVGVVKGKMSYMAPEQAQGGEVDQRADVFSLGAVLYEIISGQPPFPKGKPKEILTLVRAGVFPDLAELTPDIDAVARDIVMKACSPDPSDRYETARALQLDLIMYLKSLPSIYDSGSLDDVLGDLREEISSRDVQGTEPERDTARTVDVVGGTDDTSTLSEPLGSHRETLETPSTGTPALSNYMPSREHRETFILVGELVGMSELRGQLPDDRWRNLLFEIMRLVDEVSYKNRCAVDRSDDKGFLLLVGIPFSSENDAETAVRVARDLNEAIEAFNVNLPHSVHLSIGVGAGSLILERTLSGKRDRYSWTSAGSDWESPRGLAKEALAGEILIDSMVNRSIRQTYHTTELRDSVVGCAGPVFKVDRPKSHRERLLERRKSFTTLHGRDFELQLLRQALDTAEEKSAARTVVLVGDPGVGKASIVEEFLDGLSEDRISVVRASCVAGLNDRPFGPIGEMLHDLLEIDDTTDLRELKRQLETRLEKILTSYDSDERRYILHSVALLFNIKYADNVVESLDSSRRRSRLFLSLRRLLGLASRRGAAVLFVTDIQWGDLSSLEFLAETVRERRRRPILIALTTRPAPDLMASPWWKQLTEARHVVIQEVRDLRPQAARSLILDLLHEPMDPALVETIVDRSGGNPLFIKEILEHLHEEKLLQSVGGMLKLRATNGELQIPATVDGIVAGRIGALPPGPKRVLLRASLIGREMRRSQFESVFGELPTEDLKVLVDRGMLVVKKEGDKGLQYRFRKGLTQRVASKMLVEDERAEIHSKLAKHLIEAETDMARIDFGEVAKHLERAGEREDAGQYFLLAANSAASSSGLTEALGLVDRSLGLLEPNSAFRFSALDLRERVLKDLGMTEERRLAIEDLRHLVTHRAPAEHRVKVLIRAARFHFDTGSMEEAEGIVQEALELAKQVGDERGRGAALTLYATVVENIGRTAEAREIIERALEVYKKVEDPEGEALAWNLLGILKHLQSELEGALEAYQRAVELAKQTGARWIEEMARINIGYCHVKMGELERAVNTYRENLREILQLGHRRNEAALLANLGHAQTLLGDFSRAEHTLKRCVRLAKRHADPMRMADGLLTLAIAHTLRGHLDDAEAALKPGIKAAEEANDNFLICHGYLIRADVKLMRHHGGDIEAALADADRVLELAGPDGHLFARARALSMRARCYSRLDRGLEALDASTQAVEMITDQIVEGAEEILYHHALLMQKNDRIDDARSAIERARRLVESKRERIHNSKTQKSFLNVRGNRKIADLFKDLARS